MSYKYKTVDMNKEVEYHRGVNDLSLFLKSDKQAVINAIKSNHNFKGYQVTKLKVPFSYKVPAKCEVITIEGIKSKVINVYQNTFSVLTDEGTRLVYIKTLKFVGPAINKSDRQYLLSVRNYQN